jgi:hypothetical protein
LLKNIHKECKWRGRNGNGIRIKESSRKSGYYKAVESLDIIKQVLNKTRCDIVEIADFFIIIGIINFSFLFFDLLLIWLLMAQNVVSFLTDDLKWSMIKITKRYTELGMVITMLMILIQVFVWIHYNKLIKKKIFRY